jgi:cytochrome c oxidase assembly protein subunit 15
MPTMSGSLNEGETVSTTQTVSTAENAGPRPYDDRRRLSIFAWCTLAFNVAVILWGAVVRATGSGAGCGDHWPLCNGAFQAHPHVATIIEFTHRMTSGVSLIAVILLVIWTFRVTPKRHLARWSSAAAAVLTFNEALLGALLVLLGLTANNQSIARAFYLSLHLANTLLLLAALALAAHFLSSKPQITRDSMRVQYLPWGLLGLASTIVVGVSGSLAALSDTLFPAVSLSSALRQDFSGGGNWLTHVRLIHPLSAVLAAAVLIWLIAHAISPKRLPGSRRLGAAVLLLLVLQIILGIADVALLAPIPLQIAHLLGADLLWISLVVLEAKICVQPGLQRLDSQTNH